jgi:hypothetical protein
VRSFPLTGGGWYPTSVKKTSLYLDPDVDAALTRIARQRDITKAELIRQALGDVAATEERPRLTAIGVGHGPGDVSSDVDRHLEETGFGK